MAHVVPSAPESLVRQPGKHSSALQAAAHLDMATIRQETKNARFGRVGSRRVAGFEWSRRFLDPPYHSVRRVFPRYGWKAGLSSGAFLNNRQLKPAPGVRRPIIQFASALRASRCRAGAPLSRSSPALCREADSMTHRLEELTPPPQRPSLGSGL